MKTKLEKVMAIVFLLFATEASAAHYQLPTLNNSLVGEITYAPVDLSDNTTMIGERYDIGFNAIQNANPHLDFTRPYPAGATLQIPTQHLLPNVARKGIVINLPEMRMYYYPNGTHQVYTYPIGIGKIGKTIPITRTLVTHKTKDPAWIPPEGIREYNLQQGIVLPKVMPAGPDNPLGSYAIYMRLPTYLIHSTLFPESVGKRASFGCIRMYKSDIEEFFPLVQKGIPVVITNSPVKVGWENDRLYLEAYEPLKEHHEAPDASLRGIVHTLSDRTKNQPVLIDWQLVSYIDKERDGLPHDVGILLQ